MKLYVFPPAPNPAKVRFYLAEKRALGCPIELEEVTINLLKGEQNAPEFKAVNPFGAVPALETDDGLVIHESLAIIEYFEERFPTPSLWGEGPTRRANARQLERICDFGMLQAIAREVHATNSPIGYAAKPEVAADHRARWTKTADYLESLFKDGRPFVTGDALTVADCTLEGGLQFGRFGKIPVTEGRPRLAEWDARIRERPTAQQTILL